jgi:hypothetical protein
VLGIEYQPGLEGTDNDAPNGEGSRADSRSEPEGWGNARLSIPCNQC